MVKIVEGNLALPAHAAAVVRLLDEYARDPMGAGTGLSPHARGHLVGELRKRPTTHVIIAYADNDPAGLAICFEGFSTFACAPLLNIHDIVVLAEHRGKGLGRGLLERAEVIALRLGCCKLTLEVLEGNTAAQAAYRAGGFGPYQLDPRMGKALFWEKKLPSSTRVPAPQAKD